MFSELEFGITKTVDLHGLTKNDAEVALFFEINNLDAYYSGLMVVHGYHSGQVLKNFVRKELKHPLILDKVFVNASVTYLKIKTK